MEHKINSKIVAKKLFTKENLKKVWKRFNQWRKRHILFRLIIFFVIVSPELYEQLSGNIIIVNLVGIACEAIYSGSIPSSEYALEQYYKTKEKHRLKQLITLYGDVNKNRRLNVNEERALLKKLKLQQAKTEENYNYDVAFLELHKRVIKSDLNTLAKIAKDLHLVSPQYTTKKVRRQAFFTAHAETNLTFAPLIKKVDQLLERSRRVFQHYTKEELLENNFTTIPLQERMWNTFLFSLFLFIEIMLILLVTASPFLISGIALSHLIKKNRKVILSTISVLVVIFIYFTPYFTIYITMITKHFSYCWGFQSGSYFLPAVITSAIIGAVMADNIFSLTENKSDRIIN
jgi:hypothetical protein